MTDRFRRSLRNNTAALRRAIRSRIIIVDCEAGIILKPNGKPFHVRDNGCGYLRFKIQRNKCRQYFVHKAVYLASEKPFRHGLHIDHINDNPKDNRAMNLRQITPLENLRKARERLSNRMAEDFPVPF